MATMTEIETAAKTFSEKRGALSNVCAAFQRDLEATRRRHLEALKLAVAQAKGGHAALCSLIAASPELFTKPRSVVLHGVKLGYTKGKGKLTIEDDEKTVKLIRKHFPEQAEILIKTVEKPMKKALEELAVDDLKKLAVLVESTGDVVFAKDTAADVDKLVSAFLKDDVEERGETSEAIREAA
jgi:hypothetical protein